MSSRFRYRYRTCVLVGPWRHRREEAIADALRAGQARRADAGVDVVWVVGGAIEEGAPAAAHPRNVAVKTESHPSAASPVTFRKQG